MLTKNQFARVLMELFRSEEELDSVEDIQQKDVLKSSCLAVGMEQLGLLKGEYAEYASSRGGSLFMYVKGKDIDSLSARDIMGLLPE